MPQVMTLPFCAQDGSPRRDEKNALHTGINMQFGGRRGSENGMIVMRVLSEELA
jgi:hypothetical protein